MNQDAVECVQKEIESVDLKIHELEPKLKFKGFDIEYTNIDDPMTVCAHDDCKRFVNVGETKVTNTVYDVVCHSPCTIPVQTDKLNEEKLNSAR